MNTKIKTAEFVSPMHPDKICDRISASILDECLKQDPNSRVAIETLGGHKKIVVMGEITTNAKLNFKKIIEDEINDNSFDISINIVNQSPSIATGVDNGGAGDQGIMVGYACNNTINFMPLEYELSRSLCKYIFQYHPYDGKTQITVDDENKITDIVASFQNVSKNDLKTLTLD
ncbi:MAG: S-adenosylmethionine synthetase N-terminal domain-containing protein [Candidatus Paceibacterota bacterium]|jgi:S-adenosylmethionine synthetase